MSRPHPDPEPGLRRRALILGAAAAPSVVWGLTGCGGAAAVAVIPYFTFQFAGVTTVNGAKAFAFANFTPIEASRDQRSGSFDPNATNLSIRDASSGTQLADARPVEGTFNERLLHLIAPAATLPPLAKAYDGSFIADDTVRLTPVPSNVVTPVLTLVRVDNSFRPQLFETDWVGTDAGGRARTLTLVSVKDPVQGFDLFSNDDATVLFTGTDRITGLPDGTLTGWANMRQFEVTVSRGASTQTIAGRLTPAGITPPASPPSPQAATGIVLDDGTSLRRAV